MNKRGNDFWGCDIGRLGYGTKTIKNPCTGQSDTTFFNRDRVIKRMVDGDGIEALPCVIEWPHLEELQLHFFLIPKYSETHFTLWYRNTFHVVFELTSAFPVLIVQTVLDDRVNALMARADHDKIRLILSH